MNRKITPPQIRVIDFAITAIKNQSKRYSCTALEFGCPLSTPLHTIERYKDQYELFIRSQNRGRLPRWWGDWNFHIRARVRALEGFKQACIDAAKKA